MQTLFSIRKFFTKNYEFIFSFLLLIIVLIVAINPNPYINATLKGITIWAKIVLPSLFAFFIFTKLLMQNKHTLKIFNFLNIPFEKLFKTKKVGGYIFAMSFFSGYPLGANLISEFYNNGTINNKDAHILISYCSTSGPMFIIGSLAGEMFNNSTLGIVILISHFVGAIINGIFYRFICEKIPENKSLVYNTNNRLKKENLNEIMYNSIVSCLMVGGYIALCFTILELAFNIGFLSNISLFVSNTFGIKIELIESILKGIIELTNGTVSLIGKGIDIKILAILLTGLISFGGLSIHLQTQMFLTKCNVKYKYFLTTKVTHTIFAILISVVFSSVLL